MNILRRVFLLCWMQVLLKIYILSLLWVAGTHALHVLLHLELALHLPKLLDGEPELLR